MPEVRITLSEEQLHDIQTAAGLSGRTPDQFALSAVLDEAHSLVQAPWPICQRLNDQFDGLLKRLA
ncbi:hypothetical protein [Segniliparus rugosus]|uniref:DUF1778 domain-containing protein n=1 Tax=Segniliparus rugosus (strain ATCC BAA-974 / DSM 45345 / CCUG 50838 / CIP 108380 / JCM 13579 / CDC 945) TaxID=679197 RepID=E5XT56_SEGRC|nr:hypothetical protein [Segniliparus rugosus]EFV12467.1 hypothetical protein HMPREF9336_02678 [Segniliparus rugosus ATCC BAA-974]